MDSGKRGLEEYGAMEDHSKRRADECITRLLVTKNDMGKLIGKNGATITDIRAKSNANLKGLDVDEHNRMVLISGNLRQVLECFDLVTDVLHTSYLQANPTEHFRIQLLIDHGKAGWVVGSKGANIQGLKVKSGCAEVKMMKDPVEIGGQLLRILIFDGPLLNVRRAHYSVHEIFNSEPGSMMWGPNSSQAPSTSSYSAPMPAPAAVSAAGAQIPITALINFGIHEDTVRHLRDIQAYIAQFGLDLSVTPIASQHHAAAPQINPYGAYGDTTVGGGAYGPGGGGGGGRPAAVLNDSGPKMEFYIPKDSAGGIIGKGGVTLKELCAEYNVKIFVEREDVQNMRKVVIRGDSEIAMNQAKDRIALMCQHQAAAAQNALAVIIPQVHGNPTGYQQQS